MNRSLADTNAEVLSPPAAETAAPTVDGRTAGARAVQWQASLAVLAVACLPIGLIWDISWHITVGRDTFWTTAHIVIQLGGIIPATLFGWEALRVTFAGRAEERAAAVRFWGARGPFGAWVTIWGALAMLTSAPFDDWWHNTYGLDVKITSPPHALLGLGMIAVALGVLLKMLALQNRAGAVDRIRTGWWFTFSVGLLVTLCSVYATEYTWPNLQHNALFYKLISCLYPILLVIAARASRLKWAASIAAGTYMAIMLVMIWLLPLFPAQPKLAPIYNPVDHMVPPAFPMLLIFPAFGVDLLLQWADRRTGARRRWWQDWLLAMGIGIVFLAIAWAVQWFFSIFLITPAADNWFFSGNRQWPYYAALGDWMHRFWYQDTSLSWSGVAMAAALAMISARLGLWAGNWMVKVKR